VNARAIALQTAAPPVGLPTAATIRASPVTPRKRSSSSVRLTGRGPVGSWGDGVQHRTTRSNDVEAAAFVVALFGLLLVLAIAFGTSPIV